VVLAGKIEMAQRRLTVTQTSETGMEGSPRGGSGWSGVVEEDAVGRGSAAVGPDPACSVPSTGRTAAGKSLAPSERSPAHRGSQKMSGAGALDAGEDALSNDGGGDENSRGRAVVDGDGSRTLLGTPASTGDPGKRKRAR
jgi:hypothetical protein